MSVNMGKLELDLVQLTSKISSSDKLLAAKAISRLNNGSIQTAPSVSTLPETSSVNDGTLAFVESEGLLYVAIKSMSIWIPLKSTYVGKILTWGNDTSIITKPTTVVGGFTDWCQVAAGQKDNMAAVRTNGTLWTWGCNNNGQLGDNTVVNKSSPVSVVGGFTDWCQVAAGYKHTVAVRTNGTIWAWGDNYVGALGDGSVMSKLSPVSVLGGITDWCQVSAGCRHSVGLRTNGTIWAWGNNNFGILGDNTVPNKSSPVQVVGGFTDWRQVSAGRAHTAAVRANGTVWAWGCNVYGTLGDNTIFSRASPVSVVGGFTNWCQVAAGSSHTAAVRTNGTLWTWGNNTFGILGDNTITQRSSPVSVIGGFTDWCRVAAGSSHTAAVRTNGTLWTWGNNFSGQLGDGTLTSRSSPVSVFGNTTSWKSVSTGSSKTIGLLTKTF